MTEGYSYYLDGAPTDGVREHESIAVGVIGAGSRMTPLLTRMLEYDYVDVRIVVDANPTAPGILIAQSLGVHTTADLDHLFLILDELDFLFCVTDEPGVKDQVISEFTRTNNRRTTFLNELATRFITSLSKDSRHLVQLGPLDGGLLDGCLPVGGPLPGGLSDDGALDCPAPDALDGSAFGDAPPDGEE